MKKHVRTIMTVLLSICVLLSCISVCVSLPISRPNSRVYWRESCVIQTIRQSACINWERVLLYQFHDINATQQVTAPQSFQQVYHTTDVCSVFREKLQTT